MAKACPICGLPLDPGIPCARCTRAGEAALADRADREGPSAVSERDTTTIPPQPAWLASAREPAPAPAPSTEDTGSRRRAAAFEIAAVTGKHAPPRSSPDPTPPLWARAAAFAIDALATALVAMLFFGAGAIAYGLGDLRAAGGGSVPAGAIVLLASAPAAATACALLLFAVTSGYFVWFTGAESRTPGMALLGLRVVRTDGSALGMGGAIQRWGAFLLAGALFGLGILWTAFSDVQRGLHDHLAGTQVVRA